jgi:predicted Fe-Mo cluster-binding NifX family protein
LLALLAALATMEWPDESRGPNYAFRRQGIKLYSMTPKHYENVFEAQKSIRLLAQKR